MTNRSRSRTSAWSSAWVGLGRPERSPRRSLPPEQVGQGERVEGVALHRCGAIALTSACRDLRVDRVDRDGPTPAGDRRVPLSPFDRNADCSPLAEGRQRRPQPLQPGSVVRHPERERGRPAIIECVDLVMPLAPVEPDEDLHDAALQLRYLISPLGAAHPGRSSSGAQGTSPSGRCRLASRAEARVCRRISADRRCQGALRSVRDGDQRSPLTVHR